jgi:RsiW-degrading membrane proteinase PrsW (M82 family)
MPPTLLSSHAMVAKVAVALLPVLALLALLVVMDSFKLVGPRVVVQSIVIGGIMAALALWLNTTILGVFSIDKSSLIRYVAPVIEEILKAAVVFTLIRMRRVGFAVDATVHGFAVGAGFAVVENVAYLASLQDASLHLWIVRGFGTAVMHGSATALFAIFGKGLTDRHTSTRFVWFLPGLLVAIGIHSAYNHFFLPPVLMAGASLLVLPVVVVAVYERSERNTRHWLGVGLDKDAELLQLIESGGISESRIGRALWALQTTFPATVVGDLLCLVQIHLELSVRAKGLLIAREAGMEIPVGEDVRARFEELHYLQRSVGKSGLLAIQPFLTTSTRDLWQLHMLERSQ